MDTTQQKDQQAYVKPIAKVTDGADSAKTNRFVYDNANKFFSDSTNFTGKQMNEEMFRKEVLLDPAQQIEQEALAYLEPIDEATERGDSDIQRFYNNSTVFLTGGTGFIGKQLIEKLFRSCDIKKAFVLVRPKKGQSTKKRIEDMLGDPVFEPVRRKKPDLETRIVCVEGDVAEIRLGISNADWNIIVDEVDIIFHVAATVRFDEAIRLATLVNVRGTRETIRLGKACKNLRSFVHVSTAYSHATLSRVSNEVLEQFYERPVPPDTLIQLAETVDNDRLKSITSSLISGWPNTYTFTKATAEALVQDEIGNFPVCIVRPSIVICSYREPVPGYVDMSCLYGATGLVAGGALGVIRVVLINGTAKLSFVPLDFVNNATIAAGWETAVKRTPEVKIYHISSTNCGFTFNKFSTPAQDAKARNKLQTQAIWYCYIIATSNRFVFWILSWFMHYIPAYAADIVFNVLKLKRPRGLTSFSVVYKKFDKMSWALKHFGTNEWSFDETNLVSLWQKMSDTDRKIYNFDLKSIDWDHSAYMWILGVRKYIFKDGLKDTKKAVARQKWLKIANYLVLMFYLYVFWKILSAVWILLILSFVSYTR